MPFNSIFAWVMKKRLHQIDLFRKYPLEVQNELFERMLLNAAGTEFGLRHNFSGIHSYAAFRESIPLQDYDTMKPWIDRLMAGEQNLLWPQDTKWFAKSSGTTSDRSKFIPA